MKFGCGDKKTDMGKHSCVWCRAAMVFTLLIVVGHSNLSWGAESAIFPDSNPTAEQIGLATDGAKIPSTDGGVVQEKLQTREAAPPPTQGSLWRAQGPAPIQVGQVENLTPNDEVSGAIHVVLPQPNDANILYAAGVNGGVWKTTNATDGSPTWKALTDFLPSLSIGALEFDHTDTMYQTLIAGVGRFSSWGGDGSDRVGIYTTTNGGTSWSHSDGSGLLNDKNISGVVKRGNTVLLSVNYAVPFDCSNIGVYRSTDGGAVFSLLNFAGNSMPRGVVFDLEGHPNSPATFYSAVKYADTCDSASNGIYKTSDSGASWTKISDGAIDALFSNSNTSNVEIAVFDNGLGSHVIYASILNFGQLMNGGVFRSSNGGTTWTQMDTLQTNTTTPVGTNPRFKPEAGTPGGQGSIHFSIEVDPSNSNIVYVGGDRQPNRQEEGSTGYWPNWLGAMDYSGRLFRGNASLAPGSQWAHLTHVQNQGFVGGGTLSSSAPHADSREMAFDAANNLIEGDDGGVNRRTMPSSNGGDWFSINGNIQVTEIHDIAYDAVSDILISGNQDTGTTYQSAPNSTTWKSLTTGDGGDVAVDNVTLSAAGLSLRYSSYQYLGYFAKTTWDSSGNLMGLVYPSLTGFPGGGAQFRTPVELNRITPTRLVIGGSSSVYESMDQGDNVTQLTPAVTANCLAYGGMLSGATNPDALWVGASGAQVLVRSGPGTTLLSTSYSGGNPVDILMDPDDYETAYVIDTSDVIWQTTDMGATFTDVTGTLGSVGALRSLEYHKGIEDDYLIVGADGGVFIAPLSGFASGAFQVWNELGTNLPNAPVYDMVYNEIDDVLVVGTLGRGAWTIPYFSSAIIYKFPWPTFLPAIMGNKVGATGYPE